MKEIVTKRNVEVSKIMKSSLWRVWSPRAKLTLSNVNYCLWNWQRTRTWIGRVGIIVLCPCFQQEAYATFFVAKGKNISHKPESDLYIN